MKWLIGFLKLIRFPNLVIIAFTQYAIRFGIIYPFLDQAGLSLFLPENLFAGLVLATVMIAAAGYIINDYFDVKLDYLNKPKQLIIGKIITRRQAMFLHFGINISGLIVAAYVAYMIHHPLLVLFQLVSAALLWFYSVNFKKQVLIGNIIIAALTALVPFTAGYYEVAVMFDEVKEFGNDANTSFTPDSIGSLLFSIKYLLYWVIGYSVFAFLVSVSREIIKDCEDIEGDKAFGCRTLPIEYGIPTAKKASNTMAIITLVLLGIIETIQVLSRDWISFSYFIILISSPLLYSVYRTTKAKKKQDFFVSSQVLKLTMLTGILYTVIIYIF